jgi:hypothetical protein
MNESEAELRAELDRARAELRESRRELARLVHRLDQQAAELEDSTAGTVIDLEGLDWDLCDHNGNPLQRDADGNPVMQSGMIIDLGPDEDGEEWKDGPLTDD